MSTQDNDTPNLTVKELAIKLNELLDHCYEADLAEAFVVTMWARGKRAHISITTPKPAKPKEAKRCPCGKAKL